MSLFFEIIPAIFRQTCMTAIWFLTRQLKHVTTCDNMLRHLLRTVPLPPGLQDRGPHHLQHLPAEPSPAGGNSSYVIAGFAVYLKRNACFVFTSKPLMLLGMSFQCRIRFWFLVSGDLIQHVSSLMLFIYIPWATRFKMYSHLVCYKGRNSGFHASFLPFEPQPWWELNCLQCLQHVDCVCGLREPRWSWFWII